MPKSFSIWPLNTPGAALRLAVAILAAANLAGWYLAFRPFGGSPEELRQQAADLQAKVRQNQGSLERTRKLVEKIEAGRSEGDDFLSDYFFARREASARIFNELTQAANEAKIRPKESAIALEPIEGSDTLSMMQISANYEGTYAELLHFIHIIDKSGTLLIVEGLSATPQQGTGLLTVTLKLDTFVRDDAPQDGQTAKEGQTL